MDKDPCYDFYNFRRGIQRKMEDCTSSFSNKLNNCLSMVQELDEGFLDAPRPKRPKLREREEEENILKFKCYEISKDVNCLKIQCQNTAKAVEIYQRELGVLESIEAHCNSSLALLREEKGRNETEEQSYERMIGVLQRKLDKTIEEGKSKFTDRENEYHNSLSKYHEKLQNLVVKYEKLESLKLAISNLAAENSLLRKTGLKLFLERLFRSHEFEEGLIPVLQAGKQLGRNMVADPSAYDKDVTQLTEAFEALCIKEWPCIKELSDHLNLNNESIINIIPHAAV